MRKGRDREKMGEKTEGKNGEKREKTEEIFEVASLWPTSPSMG